jgi:hypothetical protein
MKTLARTRGARFEWQKLVTPLTPKATVAEWTRRQAEINAKVKESRTLPHTVEAIDWAHWKTQITAPGVVEEMQREYEALNFAKVEPFTAEVKETIASIEAEMATAKRAAVHGANEVKEADKAIAAVNKLKVDGINWSLEDWHKFMPGLEEQHRNEYENEDYLATDDQIKLEGMDWKAAAKEFAATGDADMGPADEFVGDMNTFEEQELVKSGTWSIARVFAGKDERAKIQERVEKALSGV